MDAAEIMKELLKTIAKSLVENPGEVDIKPTVNDRTIILELKVAKEDMGRVIGKQGRIANAIRTVMKAQAIKLDKRVIVEIVE